MRPLVVMICVLYTFSILSCERNYNIIEDSVVEEDVWDKDHDLATSGEVWLDSLCSKPFQGRRAGTEGNQRAFIFLKRTVKEMNYDLKDQVFETANGSTLHNIIVTIPGLSDSTVVIGAHFDGAVQSNANDHYQAAEDNASGTVTLLMLLKSLKITPLKTDRTIMCCFWDGEEVFESKTFWGSTYFVQNLAKELIPQILHYQNLDTIGHDHDGCNEIYIEFLGNSRINQFAHALSQNGRFVYHISESTFFNSDYTPFYQAGIPFINFHDHYGFRCDHPNHSINDTKEAISISRLVKIVHNVEESIVMY